MGLQASGAQLTGPEPLTRDPPGRGGGSCTMTLAPTSPSPARPGARGDPGPRIPSLDGRRCGAAPAQGCLCLKGHFSQELRLHVLSTADDTPVDQDVSSNHSCWPRISAKLPDGAWEPRSPGAPWGGVCSLGAKLFGVCVGGGNAPPNPPLICECALVADGTVDAEALRRATVPMAPGRVQPQSPDERRREGGRPAGRSQGGLRAAGSRP